LVWRVRILLPRSHVVLRALRCSSARQTPTASSDRARRRLSPRIQETVRTYPPHLSGVIAGTLDRTTLLAVGRLVRACAELDDIVLLYLCVISGRPEADVRTWLRGTTDRLDTAKAAARKLGMAFVFGDENLLREAIECRNTVAHGIFVGADEDGRFAFLMDRLDPTRMAQEVRSYTPADILQMADQAEWLIGLYETKLLGIGERRAARGKIIMRPHPKAPKR
jgi:hypothetical protein